MSFYPGLYRAALAALAKQPLRVLVTIGDKADPAELGELPANAHVERWVPQAAVMPHAAAMVGHGGSGSTLTALAWGVPMALLPLFADQPANARRVDETGAGVLLDGGPPALAGLGSALHDLLDDPRYAAAARAIGDEMAALPHVDEAAGVLGPSPLLMAVLGDAKQRDKQHQPGRQRRHRRIAEARPQSERRADEDGGEEEAEAGLPAHGGHPADQLSVTLSDPSGGSSATIVSPGDTPSGGTTEPVITSSPRPQALPGGGEQLAREAHDLDDLAGQLLRRVGLGDELAVAQQPAADAVRRERPVSTGPSRTWRL